MITILWANYYNTAHLQEQTKTKHENSEHVRFTEAKYSKGFMLALFDSQITEKQIADGTYRVNTLQMKENLVKKSTRTNWST